MLDNMIIAISKEENPFTGVHLEMDVYIIKKLKCYEKEYLIKIFDKNHKLINKVNVSVFRKYNRFIYMWDNISSYIWKKHTINYLMSKRGPDKKHKEVKDKSFNVPFLYSHSSIDKYRVLKLVYTDDHNNIMIRNHKILSSRNMYKVYRCIYNDNKLYPGTGIAIIMKSDGTELDKSIILILNSRLMDYVSKRYIFNLHNKPSNLQSDVTSFTPIALGYNKISFSTLCDYMLFLNKTEERQESEKEIIEFFDKEIIDSLVYELYFVDELKTNLIDLVSPRLEDISNLDSDSEKMDIIKEVYFNLIKDKEIINLINKIKSHPWIQMIEESSS